MPDIVFNISVDLSVLSTKALCGQVRPPIVRKHRQKLRWTRRRLNIKFLHVMGGVIVDGTVSSFCSFFLYLAYGLHGSTPLDLLCFTWIWSRMKQKSIIMFKYWVYKSGYMIKIHIMFPFILIKDTYIKI